MSKFEGIQNFHSWADLISPPFFNEFWKNLAYKFKAKIKFVADGVMTRAITISLIYETYVSSDLLRSAYKYI